jgi:hypothetical protein
VRAHPPDVIDAAGRTRHGWSGAVPEAPGADARGLMLAMRALPTVEATDTLIARLTGGGTSDRHVLVVVGEAGPDPAVGGAEVVRMRGEVGPGTLLAVALRRAADGVVVIGDRWPANAAAAEADALVARLADPSVAVAGLTGARSDDLRRFSPGGEPDEPVEVVGWAGLAFRARDGRARGPVDEAFSDPELLAAWWSLVLRDEGAGGTPRSAVAIRAAPSTTPATDEAVRDDRATRRDRYRIIDRFHGRRDLVTGRVPSGR